MGTGATRSIMLSDDFPGTVYVKSHENPANPAMRKTDMTAVNAKDKALAEGGRAEGLLPSTNVQVLLALAW